MTWLTMSLNLNALLHKYFSFLTYLLRYAANKTESQFR